MAKRIELEWPGKGEHVFLNPETGKWEFHGTNPLLPRPLIEIETFGTEKGKLFDPDRSNLLIKGENLFALQGLLSHYTGMVKFVYIDPPFNTGREDIQAYDDNFQHSVWLSAIHERLLITRQLLQEDGICIVHLNENEVARCMVVMDEVFGMRRYGGTSTRSSKGNFLNLITLTTNDPSGFKSTGNNLFSTANYLLVYANDKTQVILKKSYIEKGYDTQYSKFLTNSEEHYSKWKWNNVGEVLANEIGFESSQKAK